MIDLEKSIKSVLLSRLLQTLRANPNLTLDEGIKLVVASGKETGLFKKDEKIADTFNQNDLPIHHGVLNPTWLAQEKGMGVYFYFVNAQPGWLQPLVDTAKSLTGCSYYILYGAWDMLIVMHGNSEEAGGLQRTITDSKYYELAYFSAGRIPLFYGRRTPKTFDKQTVDVDSAVINSLVNDYDDPNLRAKRLVLEKCQIFLGSRWELITETAQESEVSAIVGIRLGRGFRALDPDDVLRALQEKDPILEASLVHLVETDSGYPFNYVAKLVCGNREELNLATDAIAFCRVGAVPLEGITAIVASSKQEFPKVDAEKVIGIGPSPDLNEVSDAAQKMLIDLGAEATVAFNRLARKTKLVVLRSLDELTQQIQNRKWDEEIHARIQSAYGAFARASVEGAKQGSMLGAVMLLATGVEETVQAAMRQIIEAVYKDFRRAQNELKLPTKIISRLSLGKAVMAFRTMKDHPDFGFMSQALDEGWLKRMERFADARNTWAHTGGAMAGSPDAIIDDAHRVLVDGIELIRWIQTDVLAAYERHAESLPPAALAKPKGRRGVDEAKVRPEHHKEIKLKPSRREFGIFLSHSSKDSKTAKRIAEGLRAMGYPVWYSEWAIAPSQSIVDEINKGLAQNDTLIVLLSPNSVKSEWVKRELDTALMSDLSGEGVTVIPILIEECDVPDTLRAVRYIDMRADGFQKGFIQLLEFFQARLGT